MISPFPLINFHFHLWLITTQVRVAFRQEPLCIHSLLCQRVAVGTWSGTAVNGQACKCYASHYTVNTINTVSQIEMIHLWHRWWVTFTARKLSHLYDNFIIHLSFDCVVFSLRSGCCLISSPSKWDLGCCTYYSQECAACRLFSVPYGFLYSLGTHSASVTQSIQPLSHKG